MSAWYAVLGWPGMQAFDYARQVLYTLAARESWGDA